MKTIKLNDIEWMTRHSEDELGLVFIYDNQIYRIIKKEKESYVNDLINNECIKSVMNMGRLVKTSVCTDFEVEGFENHLILEHEKVPFLTYVCEWSLEMYKEAFLSVIDLDIILIKNGYELLDAHQKNVGLIGTEAVYMDFGSIVDEKSASFFGIRNICDVWFGIFEMMIKEKGDWNFLQKISTMQLPLSRNNCYTVYGIKNGITYDLKKILRYIKDHLYTKNPNSISDSKRIRKKIAILKKYKEKIRRYDRYKRTLNISKNSTNSLSEDVLKSQHIITNHISFLNKVYGEISATEFVGGNQEFCINAIRNGELSNLMIVDFDCNNTDYYYQKIRKEINLKNKVSFAVLDPLGDDVWLQKRATRLKADVVIFMGSFYKMLMNRNMRWEILIKLFSDYTGKLFITEYSFLDRSNDKESSDVTEWKSIEWMVKEIKRYFNYIWIYDISAQKNIIVETNDEILMSEIKG